MKYFRNYSWMLVKKSDYNVIQQQQKKNKKYHVSVGHFIGLFIFCYNYNK